MKKISYDDSIMQKLVWELKESISRDTEGYDAAEFFDYINQKNTTGKNR